MLPGWFLGYSAGVFDWVAGWLVRWVAGWLVRWVAGWLAGRLADLLGGSVLRNENGERKKKLEVVVWSGVKGSVVMV